MAVVDGVLYSWGVGDGGRLGLGDLKDRIRPCPIEYFKGQVVLDFACGTWTSVAIVILPPLVKGGYVSSDRGETKSTSPHHAALHLGVWLSRSIRIRI